MYNKGTYYGIRLFIYYSVTVEQKQQTKHNFLFRADEVCCV